MIRSQPTPVAQVEAVVANFTRPPPCTPRFIGTPPIPLHVLCAGLSANKYDEWAESAQYSKAPIFQAVRQATQPYGLTSREFSQFPASYNLTSHSRLLLVGDSLLRDLASTLQKVMPNARVAEVKVWRTGDAIAGYNDIASRNGKSMFSLDHNETFVSPSAWDLHTHGYRVDGSTFAGDRAEKEFLDVLLGFVAPSSRRFSWPDKDSRKPYDAVFVGGMCLHHMLRQSMTSFSFELQGRTRGGAWTSIYGRHRLHFESVAEALSCLAARLDIPFVMLGCPTLDVATVLAHEPKHDWLDFLPFDVLKIWLAAEKSVARSFEQRQQAQEIPPTSRLYFMHPRQLSETCPGVRCDGIHFGTDYGKTNGCLGTLPLWHSFLWQYLSNSGLPIGPCAEGSRGDARYSFGEAASMHRPLPSMSVDELMKCLRPVRSY